MIIPYKVIILIAICVDNMDYVFGNVIIEKMELNNYDLIAFKNFNRIPKIYCDTEIDELIIINVWDAKFSYHTYY